MIQGGDFTEGDVSFLSPSLSLSLFPPLSLSLSVDQKARCVNTKPRIVVFTGCRELEESASMVLNLKMRTLHVCLTIPQ
jgi:hypothetical protein